MPERPPTHLSQPQRLAAVVLGGVAGIVLVLTVVLDLGLLEAGLILLPLLVVAAPALAFYLWARRRGDL